MRCFTAVASANWCFRQSTFFRGFGLVKYNRFIGIDPGLTGAIAFVGAGASVSKSSIYDIKTVETLGSAIDPKDYAKRRRDGVESRSLSAYNMDGTPKILSKKTRGVKPLFGSGSFGGRGSPRKSRSPKIDISNVQSVFNKECLSTDTPLTIIENQYARPVQGVCSSFSLGYTFGSLISFLVGRGLPFLVIDPNRWKRQYSLLGKDKSASIEAALDLYPDADIRLKKHHNRAESLLLAHYGKILFDGLPD